MKSVLFHTGGFQTLPRALIYRTGLEPVPTNH